MINILLVHLTTLPLFCFVLFCLHCRVWTTVENVCLYGQVEAQAKEMESHAKQLDEEYGYSTCTSCDPFDCTALLMGCLF